MSLRQITVKNIGPIKNGTVDLKPMTVFIGPSNSGKSYMSTLIYSILSSEKLDRISRPRGSSKLHKFIKKELQDLVRHNKGDTITVPLDSLQKMYFFMIQEMFGSHLKKCLERNFFAPLESLTRRGAAHAQIKISTFDDIETDLKGNLKTGKIAFPSTKYTFKISAHVTAFDMRKDVSEFTITVGKKYKQVFFGHHASDLMIKAMHSELWKNNARLLSSFYFPASRSGILETYPETAATIIEDISYSMFTNSDEPTIGGITTDFIAPLLTLKRKKTPFFNLAEEMEFDILRGNIDMRIDKGSLPRILYTSDGSSIPLDNASSAVSEIAPLSIYLKYVVQKNNLLIIEEPESHLHPHAQAILSKYIIKMVRAGLNVLVTTHSTFLLAEFGKYVLAGRLDEKTRKRLKVETYITKDEVSSYVFKKNKDESYDIESIPFDDENGISQEEFAKVEHELYDQWIKVVNNIPKK